MFDKEEIAPCVCERELHCCSETLFLNMFLGKTFINVFQGRSENALYGLLFRLMPSSDSIMYLFEITITLHSVILTEAVISDHKRLCDEKFILLLIFC